MRDKIALIIGAGPAGLTAAMELLRRTNIRPIVLDTDAAVGGISKTVIHRGNRMDIGGHRFFSKSDWVMRWWQDILPIEHTSDDAIEIGRRDPQRTTAADGSRPSPAASDQCMLVRSRVSRIYFLRHFFDYPIKLDLGTARKLGAMRLVRIGASYLHASLFPRKPESSLEDFIVNRFGDELYRTFFKDYTEKVWGVPCTHISPTWGAQRIKGLSVGRALLHAVRKLIGGTRELRQRSSQTSLIERFLYPKFGPGQMWQTVADRVSSGGGEIRLRHRVTGIALADGQVVSVSGIDQQTGANFHLACDYLISSMPVCDLVAGMSPSPPNEVRRVAAGLQYRDFLTVGLLVKKMKTKVKDKSAPPGHLLPDNWIYIQEKDVRLGRLQIFNNWSPYLVKDPDTVWLGLEYFCNEVDDIWHMTDEELVGFGATELGKIGMIDPDDAIDGVVVRMPKAYPAYFGTYDQFRHIVDYVDAIDNLFLIGRNGMHRYNNQDHSMLTAKLAVDNITSQVRSKANIWAVNIDDEYHEETH